MQHALVKSIVGLFAGFCLAGGVICTASAQSTGGGNLKRIPDSSTGGQRAPRPPGELSGDLVYEFLVAEVALQRGQPQLAAQAYLDLARKTRDPRIARRATEVAWFARMPQVSADAARLWNEIAPQSEEAQLWQLQIWVATNHLDEAKPGLQRMLERSQSDQTFLQLSRLLSEVADKQAALALMKELAQPYSENAAAHVAVAQLAANADEEGTALDEARVASKLRPSWEIPAMLEASVLQKHSPSLAAARLKTYLDANPKSPEVRLAYARALAADQNYDAARAEFKKLLEAYPENVNVVYPVALLSMQLEDYKQAEVYLKRLLELDFQDVDLVYLYLGQVTEEQKHYVDALQWYEKVGPGDNYLTAQIRGAMVVAKQGDVDGALRLLHDTTAENNQQRVQLSLAETQVLRDGNRTEEAFKLAEQSLDKLPNHPDLLYDYAMIAERLDRLDVMESNLRKIMTIKPEQAQAYNALGYSFADRGIRLPEAHELIEKALKLSPDDLFIVDSLGWVQFKQGDLNGALQSLQRAYSGRPDPEIAAHLGEVLWRMGRTNEAERLWSSASKKAPDNDVLQKTMKRFLSVSGNAR